MSEYELELNEKTINEIPRIPDDIKKVTYHTLEEVKRRLKI
jgi:hypothetical protein